MIAIFIITSAVIFIYALYPVFLRVFCASRIDHKKEIKEITSVSLILLSYNGKEYLRDKIKFLLNELACFQQYELIVIDDNSTDGSGVVLNEFKHINNVRIIRKKQQSGISSSMNFGMQNAKYDYIIFCDQRQQLSENIMRQIVGPLKYSNIGAVSGCLSHIDKDKKYSAIRRHENTIKSSESKAGNLIGVYGPFYAIKKSCYVEIPDRIILDDLFLSLKILKSKRVILMKGCSMIDDNFSILYNYTRTKRYLNGLIQLLSEKNLIGELNTKQKIMLFWHKYFRLLIPAFLFLCYINFGMKLNQGPEYIFVFTFVSLICLISIFPNFFKSSSRVTNVIRMNMLYLAAIFDILMHKLLFHKSVINKKEKHNLFTGNIEPQS
ncbi:MAG: glycosyltransferase [Bacteroidales bacterium]|nr:glycosyltransferase [Bacteroidales bacterium]